MKQDSNPAGPLGRETVEGGTPSINYVVGNRGILLSNLMQMMTSAGKF